MGLDNLYIGYKINLGYQIWYNKDVDKNFYLNHLDQLTDRERTIFLYRIVLKVPTKETANRLRLSIREIKETTKMLQEQSELLLIKADLMEAYVLGDVL